MSDENDFPARVAEWMRDTSGTLREYSGIIGALTGTLGLLVAVVGLAAPEAVDTGFTTLGDILAAETTDTVLIAAVFIQVIRMPSPGILADGGSEENEGGAALLLILFLAGLIGGGIASYIGDQWVLAGFLVGVAAWLLLFENE